MLLLKSHLLAGLINLVISIISRAVSFLYKFLKLLHLRLLFTVCLIGILSELLFSLLSQNANYFIIFLTLVGAATMRFLYIVLTSSASKLKKPNTAPQEKKLENQPQINESLDDDRASKKK